MNEVHEVVVTGASGFIGSHVCEMFSRAGLKVRRHTRLLRPGTTNPNEWVVCDDLAKASDDDTPYRGARTVVHLAARAHILDDKAVDPLTEFRKINTEGTLRIAKLAWKAGVKRFVFVSSIGVNGNFTKEKPFNENSIPNPTDLYAISKYEAELALQEFSKASGLEVVIVRPPLVYGPGNPGNFLRLLKLIKSGLPLPFGAVKNLKSFIYVENLASALLACIQHPIAANQTYVVSDGYDLSTPDLITALAKHMQRHPMLVPVSMTVIRALAKLAGKMGAIEKMISSLQVDSTKIRTELGWSPPVPVDEGIRKTAEWFVRNT